MAARKQGLNSVKQKVMLALIKEGKPTAVIGEWLQVADSYVASHRPKPRPKPQDK